MSAKETVYFRLTLASPVHVGCGEVYEPMNFVIDEDSMELISFDTGYFMSLLTDDELAKLSTICRKGTVASLQELYKFMRNHSHVARGTAIKVSEAFMNHYKDVLEKPSNKFVRELNMFEINRTFFNPIENEPVIPGSAIKGAIRTAVLNFRNNGSSRPQFKGRNASKSMEERLLQYSFKNMGSDPFRLVKVSDFVPSDNVKRRICYAVDIKKRPSEKDASAPYQMQEMIEAGSSFWGSITVSGAPRSIRKPVTMDEIKNAMTMFYGTEKKREERELSGIQVKPVSLEGHYLPLRIGRHSGAECVTVKGHRRIKIMLGKRNKKFMDHATTVWLASDTPKPGTMQELAPMGWSGIRQLSEDEVQKLKQERDAIRKEQLKRIEQQQEEAEKAEQECIRRQQQVEEAIKQKEREEAAEQERLLGLTKQWESAGEVERYIAIVRGDDLAKVMAPDKDVMRDVWPKLEGLERDEQKRLAAAFRERWKKEGKWKVKKKRKKQFQKVHKVKEILDDSES